MARITRKEIKHDEFVDSTWRIVERLEQNIRPIIIGGVAIVVLVAVASGVLAWQKARSKAGADLLSRGQAALVAPVAVEQSPQPDAPYTPTFQSEQARYEEALERLSRAAESGGAPGRVAHYLRGVALLEAGRTGEAVEVLERAADRLGDDPTIGGAVRARLAHAYQQSGKQDAAAEIWRELADEDGAFPADLALLELARLHQALGDVSAARDTYNELIEVHADSPLRSQAEEGLAELEN
jgi:tetratricopeptide (TPR) repeat protein